MSYQLFQGGALYPALQSEYASQSSVKVEPFDPYAHKSSLGFWPNMQPSMYEFKFVNRIAKGPVVNAQKVLVNTEKKD